MEPQQALEENEPVSSEELRALIERFGERQSAPNNQPTVRDVAETLQVEPATVTAMLRQLREAKSQQEIKERLDRLERENAELRARSEESHELLAGGFRRGGRQRRFAIALSAMLFAFAFAALSSGSAAASAGKQVVALAIVAILLVGLKVSQRDRR